MLRDDTAMELTPESAGPEPHEAIPSFVIDSEREKDRLSLAISLVLHLVIVACIALYGIIGHFHHNLWGGTGGTAAVQVNIASTLPLPTDQPINQNVLSTEMHSQAAALKEKQAEDSASIPLQSTQPKKRSDRGTAQRTPPPQPQTVEQNRARYGEQAGSNIPRSSQQLASSGHTSVTDASFGTMFGWYVTQIDRTMDASGSRSMTDARVPKAAKATIQFAISRDGSHDMPQLIQSSGSSSWDSACIYAARRVDRFERLPDGYRGSYLQVLYDCTY